MTIQRSKACCSVFLLLSAFGVVPLSAAIIGTNPPAQSLTLVRIALLPSGLRAEWKTYYERSVRQKRADQAALQRELKARGLKQPLIPPSSSGTRTIPMHEPPAWYGGLEARRIADIILSFQTPAGGWGKNLDFTQHPRAPGEHFAPDNGSRFLSPGDHDAPDNPKWHYVGTFDNDATVTQLRFLAKVTTAVDRHVSGNYRAAFQRGVDYILAAQYPNGGWPQVWPLEGGYHDAITFNDDAMLNVLSLLRDIADADPAFLFVSARTRALARKSFARGIDCVLSAQVLQGQQRTIWCQQYDPLTLAPASARNYEMPALASAESAQVTLFLMKLPSPGPDITAAVHGAAAWFAQTQSRGIEFKDTDGTGRRVVESPGARPLWARYYQIGTNRPIFGDRDKTIHDTLDEISRERRNGYAWYRNTPAAVLEQYAGWAELHTKTPQVQPATH